MKQTFRLLLVLATIFVSTEYAFGQTKYPYTKWGEDKNGVVIVSRDDNGGVHPDALLGDAGNTIEALLQIKPTDEDDEVSWADAQITCVGGWRLPTKRELQLIWLMGGAKESQYGGNTGLAIKSNKALNEYGAEKFTPLEQAEYWISTADGWYVSFSDGKVASNITGDRKVRCVKAENDELFPLPTSKEYAYSNIILKDGKLVFATRRGGTSNATKGIYSNNDIPANSQGLYFRWGSLVGLSSNGANASSFSSANVAFIPSGTAPTEWEDVPYMRTETYTYGDLTANHIKETYGDTGYDASQNKGDICRYITKQGWVEGSWRMPTAKEIEDFAMSGSKIDSYYGTPSTSPAWSDIVTDKADGTNQINNGWWFGPEVKNTSINTDDNKEIAPEGTRYFPAGGRYNIDGILYGQGTDGRYWSSTAYNASSGYNLYFNSSVAKYVTYNGRGASLSVRCVAE